MAVKQVIVIRRDLKMRRGKEIAQGGHATMMWLSDRLRRFKLANFFQRFIAAFKLLFCKQYYAVMLSEEEINWIEGSFTKVCLQVNSEEELLAIYAKTKDLTACLVTDSGKTEFDGVPTRTCIAIGPNYAERIDEITKELKLY